MKSRTRLSDFTFTFHFHALEKEMATHSSVLAWRIPGTGEPGGLLSMGSHSRTRLKRLSSVYIYTFFFNILFHYSYHGMLTVVPCRTQQDRVVTHPVCNSLPLLRLNSQSILPSLSLGDHQSLLYVKTFNFFCINRGHILIL